MAQRIGRGRRRLVAVLVVAVVLVLLVLGFLSSFYVNILWFREVHYSNVFWTVFWAKVLLGAGAGVVFFGLLYANLLIVRRMTPRFRAFSPEQEVLERYRTALEPYLHLLVPAFAAVVAVFVGIGASSRWQTFLLWRSANATTAFGFLDPVFHRDPSFYVFILPFQQFVQGWLFSALVGVTVIAAVAHYLTGGIRSQGEERVTPQVKAHLSVLLGLIVLVKAWGYDLGKYTLLTSSRGVVTGASYTDIHAQLPALRLLVFIAIACAILFLVNIRFRGWALPILGVGLLGVASIVVGGLVPAAVEKFSVLPQQQQREAPYIARNITATRFAYGLSKIQTQVDVPNSQVSATEAAANAPTISNIRLWSPSVLQSDYNQVQRFQPYYLFKDVNVDRYAIGGTERMVMIAAREIDQGGLGSQATWQNVHLTYTHGYGAVASLVNGTTASGGPNFILQNIPLQRGSPIALGPKGQQIYFGEVSGAPYVVVDTRQQELNYPNPSGAGFSPSTYQGSGGIPIGSFFRRMVFAYRFHDINLLISNLIDGRSRILINRDLAARVQTIAPFLQYDGDPYAAVVGGRLDFIWDAYTTTDLFPYSERVDLGTATNGAMSGQVNYIRNSVKVVVDAYDGTVKFYVVDQSDPLIRVWERAFPGMFTPASQAPAALRAHFRYPENLLQVQAYQYGRYHVTNVAAFYNNSRRWAVPTALPSGPEQQASGLLRPYYVLVRLPGSDAVHFVLFEPMTPYQRQNMVAYLAAGSDPGTGPGTYGTLTAVQFPGGENVTGPSQAYSFINQDPKASQQISLLSQRGSRIQYGDLTVVPVGSSFLYVDPIFLVASGGNGIPELKLVAVANGTTIGLGSDLQAALADAVGQPPPSGGGGTQPPPSGTTVQSLLAQALAHFQQAQADLKAGDLAGYATEIQAAQKLVQQASKLASGTAARG